RLGQGPVSKRRGGVLGGRSKNEFVVVRTHSELEESELDLVVSGTRDAITMIEGFAREMSEENMVEAILYAHKHIAQVVDMIEQLRKDADLEARAPTAPAEANPLIEIFRQRFYNEFRERKQTTGKHSRSHAVRELRD